MSLASLGALWRWRGFVLASVRRELASRYAGASLGALWHFLQPLAQILVYTLIFAEVMRARLPGNADTMAYGIYLCAGLLPWQFFAEIVGRGSGMFLEHGPYLKKSGFPRVCIPAIVVLSAAIHFLIIFGLFLGFLLATGRLPPLPVLATAIPLILLLAVFAAGLGLWLGTLNVFLRDVGQILGIVLQFWFWLTPIVWTLQVIPEGIRPWIALNPLTGLMAGLQEIFVSRTAPDWSALAPALVAAGALLLMAAATFRNFSRELADEL